MLEFGEAVQFIAVNSYKDLPNAEARALNCIWLGVDDETDGTLLARSQDARNMSPEMKTSRVVLWGNHLHGGLSMFVYSGLVKFLVIIIVLIKVEHRITRVYLVLLTIIYRSDWLMGTRFSLPLIIVNSACVNILDSLRLLHNFLFRGVCVL